MENDAITAQPKAEDITFALTFKSVVLTSDDPDKTAAFYRDVLEIPLESEQHRGTDRHHACQLGSMHFAIHRRETFWLKTENPASAAGTIVSFTVGDVERLCARLEVLGVEVVARTNIGPMKFVAVRDPDGRTVCCGTTWPARGASGRPVSPPLP